MTQISVHTFSFVDKVGIFLLMYVIFFGGGGWIVVGGLDGSGLEDGSGFSGGGLGLDFNLVRQEMVFCFSDFGVTGKLPGTSLDPDTEALIYLYVDEVCRLERFV